MRSDRTSVAFATRNIRDQRFFPIPVNRNSIARPARKSTWIGSSILRPGSPGCVLMPREKGTEKVHLLRSIAPRFRNRARADLERFQRRADRALWRAIAETKRKERKKKKKIGKRDRAEVISRSFRLCPYKEMARRAEGHRASVFWMENHLQWISRLALQLHGA